MPKLGPKILLLQPSSNEFEDVYYRIIKPACERNYATVYRINDLENKSSLIIETIYNEIEKAELIICNISKSNPNTMYELGYVHALKKPVIVIASDYDRNPFDISSTKVFFYSIDTIAQLNDDISKLSLMIREALENPNIYGARPKTDTTINSIFISYSHCDLNYLKRLMVHLRPLQKLGIIDSWDDTKLQAGDNWKIEIEKALIRARVAILLISADFLASEFIVENELPPILNNAKIKGTRIIPIVIKPCRFIRDNNLRIFQAINDPNRPLANLPEIEQEKIYDEVSEQVESMFVIKA